ncbi:MAG: hypothetical protein L0L73_06465, partial [Acidipropionibacterium jensenii]|uniref:hypothetical protein n=1 Tax=Acidipropionibacterium jensenii TaxID=1749 RepID=UPI00264791AD
MADGSPPGSPGTAAPLCSYSESPQTHDRWPRRNAMARRSRDEHLIQVLHVAEMYYFEQMTQS